MPRQAPPSGGLDDPGIYAKLDPSGIGKRICELPQQCSFSWQRARSFDLPGTYAYADRIVILGMGGSAIGADLLRSLALEECRIPVEVVRDYDLPRHVGNHSLVIASSYSGNTEETLSAFKQAQERGCKLLALTSGGMLAQLAQEARLPCYIIEYRAEPRAALAHSFIPLVAFLQRLGYLTEKDSDIEEAVGILGELRERLGPEAPTDENPAKLLALKLWGRFPVVYGAGLLAEVARRWKGQINENAKAWAVADVLPELNHNSVVGYEHPASLVRECFVIFLHSTLLHPRVLARYEITKRILDERGIAHEAVEAKGGSAISQILSVVLFGDLVSYYLALLYGVDPSPVKVIDFLKDELSKV